MLGNIRLIHLAECTGAASQNHGQCRADTFLACVGQNIHLQPAVPLRTYGNSLHSVPSARLAVENQDGAH